ncbi:MAG: DUF2269 family protein [Comamonadaceae bacterium]|nr:MAG: DUF2269 family protein [Comamonadaceae bacterium]
MAHRFHRFAFGCTAARGLAVLDAAVAEVCRRGGVDLDLRGVHRTLSTRAEPGPACARGRRKPAGGHSAHWGCAGRSGAGLGHGAPLPPLHWRYFTAWGALGVPALVLFLAISWLMTAKPVWGG